MSKTKKKAIWIGIAIACILLFLYIFVFNYPKSCTIYTMSPEACEFFYGCTPQEYADEYDKTHTLIKVDDRGYLIEYNYSRSEKLATNMNEAYIWAVEQNGIKISQDYSDIYFEGEITPEVNEMIESAAYACATIQLYNGESDIGYKITVKDIDTGEITTREESASEYDYSYVTLEFSSLKDYYDFVDEKS